MTRDGAPRLLEGVRIVDLTSVVFGPYATQLMADMGADVIKVEAPSGDIFRRVGRPAKTRGMGGAHMTINRGKRSVVLDLKRDGDKARLRELIATADVFIHNVRGRAMERLGFGYEAARAIRPDLVYVHCTGFGSEGPYARLQAYDDVIQAATGATSLMGKVDGNPAPRYVPTVIADKVGGLHAAYALLAAYVHRLRTGEGQFVEVPMFEAFTQFLLEEHLNEATFDPPTGPLGYDRQLAPERQPFPTADGAISIVPYTDANWATIFHVLGDPSMMDSPRFETPLDRLKRAAELYAAMARLTPARTTADWLARLSAAEIPAMACRDLRDIMDDPHLRATGFFQRATHPTEGAYVRTRPPVRFSAAPDLATGHAPGIGEHTAEVLAELEAGGARKMD